MSDRPPTSDILTGLPRRSRPGASGVFTVPPVARPRRDAFARPMFWLAGLHLLFIAGLIHRVEGLVEHLKANPDSLAIWELRFIVVGTTLLWLTIVAEGIYRVVVLADGQRVKEIIRFLIVCIFPPARMGSPSLIRQGQIWLPGLRWREINERLEEKLASRLRMPMIGFALLVLPLLGLELFNVYKFDQPWFRAILDVSGAIIWLAFAVDFILGMSIASKKVKYFIRHMLDFLIVVIPMFQFILTQLADAALLGRLVRLSRLARISQLLGRSALLYQFRTLPLKAWQALVALEAVQAVFQYLMMRLLGIDPLQRKRAKIEEQLRELDRQRTALLEERLDVDRRIAIRAALKKEESE